MNTAELRQKSVDELKQALVDNKREQFNLRMQKGSTSQLKQTHLMRIVRRSIARIHTLLREKEAGKA